MRSKQDIAVSGRHFIRLATEVYHPSGFGKRLPQRNFSFPKVAGRLPQGFFSPLDAAGRLPLMYATNISILNYIAYENKTHFNYNPVRRPAHAGSGGREEFIDKDVFQTGCSACIAAA
jgi:hypothetical protein